MFDKQLQLAITFKEVLNPLYQGNDKLFPHEQRTCSITNHALQAIDYILFLSPLFLYQHAVGYGEPGAMRPFFSRSHPPDFFIHELRCFDWLKSSLAQSNDYFHKILSERDQRVKPLDASRAINDVLLHDIITGQLPLDSVDRFELLYFSQIVKSKIFSNSSFKELPWSRFSPENNLMHRSVKIVMIQERSPLEIILFTLGPLGAIFGLIITGLWIGNYLKHSSIDLKNKKLALEASEYILEKLQNDEVEITPELVAALIKHAEMSPINLPSIANIKLNVK